MPLKGACVTDGFWSCRYGIFAMHFLMGPQGSLSIVSSSVIDQVLLVLVNLRFMYIEGKIPKGYSTQYGAN
jgi:hypothetical protein